MHAWEAIQKTLNYIEGHLGEELEIGELAKLAALSPFYYQRLFSRLVKKPVRDYVKQRRLAKACEALQAGEGRILNVAVECGFRSHETFTRAFKEAFSMTPEQYRKHPVGLNRFIKPDLLLGYTMIDEGVPLITDGLVFEVNRETLREPADFLGVVGFVPIAGQFPAGEATGVDVPGEIWKRFHRIRRDIPQRPNGRELGVSFPGGAPEGSFSYFAGAEAEPGNTEERFTHYRLPARDYAVFRFEAENFAELTTVALDKILQYSGHWLKKHGLIPDAFAAELYSGSGPGVTRMELWLPVAGEARPAIDRG